MSLPPHQYFSLPRDLITPSEQINFCLDVIGKYRQELPILRSSVTVLKRQSQKEKGETAYWKEKYQEEKQRNGELKKENDVLKNEIEKLTKTTNRYRASLFDHGNFQSPTDTQTKKKGGQPGHADTNREQKEDPGNYSKKRVFLASCPGCHSPLSRVNATRQKILVDIVLNPQVVKQLIESERQWCRHCKKEVVGMETQSLPFSEYGLNTLMMAILLRYRCLLPLSKISLVLKIGYGLAISESGLNSLFHQSKEYLGSKYEELKKTVRGGDLMYNDETGWQVRGKNAWMWIMASEAATVYVAAESRGKGIATEMYGNSQANSMHDGYGGYSSAFENDKHLYCWAHLLRFCFEETVEKTTTDQSVKIRDTLVDTYHLKKDPKYDSQPQKLEKHVSRQIDTLLKTRTTDTTSKRILHRLRTQRDGLIRALLLSPNGTNNFAEQELRPIALMRKISFGSDTYTGMETTAVLSSVVQTIARTKEDTFFPELSSALHAGVSIVNS